MCTPGAKLTAKERQDNDPRGPIKVKGDGNTWYVATPKGFPAASWKPRKRKWRWQGRKRRDGSAVQRPSPDPLIESGCLVHSDDELG